MLNTSVDSDRYMTICAQQIIFPNATLYIQYLIKK